MSRVSGKTCGRAVRLQEESAVEAVCGHPKLDLKFAVQSNTPLEAISEHKSQ